MWTEQSCCPQAPKVCDMTFINWTHTALALIHPPLLPSTGPASHIFMHICSTFCLPDTRWGTWPAKTKIPTLALRISCFRRAAAQFNETSIQCATMMVGGHFWPGRLHKGDSSHLGFKNKQNAFYSSINQIREKFREWGDSHSLCKSGCN